MTILLSQKITIGLILPKNININDINLYGFNGVFTIIEGNPTTRVSINNITNVDNPQTQRAVQNALGAPLAYGANNNAKAKLKLTSGNGTGSELTIIGNDISAVESIELVFKEKVDMKHRNGSVIDTGNLEFISFGKVRFNKGFTGNITNTKTMRGEVTFVKIPDIYEIGSQTKQVSKVMFEGNHEHKLHIMIFILDKLILIRELIIFARRTLQLTVMLTLMARHSILDVT
ncbi:hypothetical protein [Rickettsia argasii]|uniref:Uncharacterized protein n=1 Tax=Rickettsia argasii T170-B TaxID=1268837 RepID=A0A0F3RET9_9RICK|nr:hypothetical protein RAT170B_0849 [Rickettsia argasii T170-B]